jgi:eukaryotic-like serine/threonine-protein kinase
MTLSGRIRHYRVLELLGRSGKGETYLAVDERMTRPAALTIIHPALVADPVARRQIVRQLQSAAVVSHPRICATYEVLEDGDLVVVATDVAHGKTVLELTAPGPVDPLLVCRIGREVGEGLAAAHGRGLVHGGLSASTVVLGDDGHVKILEFGFAAALAAEERPPEFNRAPADLHSRTMLVGTPVYMAPELLSGGPPTAKSDLYAAGVVLYRLATGKLPFAERMSAESLVEMLTLAPVPPSLLVGGIPGGLERVIMCLLEKKPDARFPSAESVAATLALAERGERSRQ